MHFLLCKKQVVLFLHGQIEPYIPYEFTCEGMLQRVNILVEKQVRRTSTIDWH